MGILEDLIGGNRPVTPGLLDAAGYMDPAQYDRARRSSAMDGLWAGLLAGGGPSLEPRNFYSALGVGMQGREQYGSQFDKDQLASSQAAAQRALIPQRQLELEQKRDALKLVSEKLPQLLPGYGGAGGGVGGGGGGAGVGVGGAGVGVGGGGAGGGPGSISPAEHYTFLLNNGASANEAALLTSAAGAESSFRPDATHDGGIGYGLYGHNGPRLEGMRSVAGVGAKDPIPWQQQSLYALAELRGQAPTSEIKAGEMARAATTPEQLTQAQLAFERPKGWNTGGGQSEKRLALTNQYFNNPPYRQAVDSEVTPSGTVPAITSTNRPGFDTMFPDPSGRAASLGGPVPAAIAAGVPPAAPAPAATTDIDRLNNMTPQQQHLANLAAGGRGLFPPNIKFNRNGSPISPDLSQTLPGQQSGPNIPPEVARSLGRRADAGGPDTVVATGPLPQLPGLNGAPAAGGPAAMQLAALVSGGSGGRLPTGAAPGGDTVVPPSVLPAAPAAPAPAATQPPETPLVPGAMPAMPAPTGQTLVPRPELMPQPGVPERPNLTPAPAARPLPATPPPPSLTAPDFSQVGQAVPADVARRAGIALQVGLGLKILGLDVPAISKIAELPLDLQKSAYEAAVKAPYELRNTQYQSLLNMTTEQWKNQSENDRTLWSAALGMDKTDFEARIRQGEKDVENQNAQINKNWDNMNEAEKAKAAASNQFANTKFQAEMEQYGKWNSPIDVKEYDPVTQATRTRTSTPAMEYRREMARTGGPQGLTVGQALGAPGGQQAPAPAPGAMQPPAGMQPPAQNFAPAPVPGAAPIPLRQGGAFIRGEPGAGQVTEAQAAGTELGKLRTRIEDEAAQAGTNLSDLRVMQTSAQQLALQGPFAGWAQGVNRVINSLTGEQRDRVAANELVTKNSERLIRDTVRQSDSQPAAIQLSMTRNSMPTAATSKQGFAEVLGQMTGSEEWRQYRADMANAYRGTTGTMDQFQSWLPVSPHAFMVDNMPQVFKQQLFQRLQNGGDAGKAEARMLSNQLRLLEQWRANRSGMQP